VIGRAIIGVYAMGGTIAASGDEGPGLKPRIGIDTLMRAVPDIEVRTDLRLVDFMVAPSAELSLEDVVLLADRLRSDAAGGVAGFVISQGTDTLEECAFALDVLWDLQVPVVVTGAMRAPGAAGADGPANLTAAICIARCSAAHGAGVLVVMNDEVHAARFVRKMHTSSVGAFESPGRGPIGAVTEGRVSLWGGPVRGSRVAVPSSDRRQAPVALAKVALGDDGRCLAAVIESGYKGLVVEGMGGGHVPSRMVEALTNVAEQIPVVLASRTGSGALLRETYGVPGAEIDLLDRGLIFADSLDGLKARIQLSLLLMAGASDSEVRASFERDAAVSTCPCVSGAVE